PPRIEEQHPPESDSSRGDREFRRFHRLWQRFEEGLRLLDEHRVVFGVESVGHRDEAKCHDEQSRTRESPMLHATPLLVHSGLAYGVVSTVRSSWIDQSTCTRDSVGMRMKRGPSAGSRAEEPVDPELLRRMRLGDETALEALYGRYGGLVFTLALRIVGDPELAREVLQDTFLRSWDGRETYEPERGRVPWWLMG